MTVVFVTRYAFVNSQKKKKTILNFEIKMSSTHSCIGTDWKSETKCRKYSKLHLSHLHFRWNVIFIQDSNFKININNFRLSFRTHRCSGSFKLNELITKSRPTHFFQRNVHISRSFFFVFFGTQFWTTSAFDVKIMSFHDIGALPVLGRTAKTHLSRQLTRWITCPFYRWATDSFNL